MREFTNYNFHDLFSLALDIERPYYGGFFEREFCGVKTGGSTSQPDIIVHADRSEDRRMKTWPHCYRYHRIFKARWDVAGWESDTLDVRFISDWSFRVYPLVMAVFLETMLLAPLFYWIGLKKGFLLVHAAAISRDETGTVISAVGGSGKTTLTLRLVDSGLNFMGDDLTFIKPDGTILAYPRPLHLFSYVTNNLDFIKLNSRLKTIIRFKDVIRVVVSTILQRRFLMATRVPFQEAMPGHFIMQQAKVENLFLLDRNKPLTKTDLSRRASFEGIRDRLIENGEINHVLFDRLLPSRELKMWAIEREKELMESFLGQAKSCFIFDPRLVPLDNVKNILFG